MPEMGKKKWTKKTGGTWEQIFSHIGMFNIRLLVKIHEKQKKEKAETAQMTKVSACISAFSRHLTCFAIHNFYGFISLAKSEFIWNNWGPDAYWTASRVRYSFLRPSRVIFSCNRKKKRRPSRCLVRLTLICEILLIQVKHADVNSS